MYLFSRKERNVSFLFKLFKYQIKFVYKCLAVAECVFTVSECQPITFFVCIVCYRNVWT